MSEAQTSSAPAAVEQRVASVAALRAGQPTYAKVNGRLVALFACEDGVAATAGRCPHASGPLHEGAVEGTTLVCPWHGWSFDLKTGACEEDPDLVLQRYPVRIDGDDVWVTV